MNTFSNLEARVIYDQLQQVLSNQKQIMSMLQKQQQSVNSYGPQINDDQIRKAILDINPNIVSNRDGFNSACKQYSSW